MSLCEVHWKSEVLRKQVGAYVILPDVGRPPFPTFYLLHGLSDDHTTWLRRTRIEWYVRELPLIVVMPDGLRGFYTNNEVGPPFARYVGEELVRFVERNFPARPERPARAIGGLSMGGYGAMRLAPGYPEAFASANSHSGAFIHTHSAAAIAGGPLLPEEHERIFGPSPHGTEHDLAHLARRAHRAGTLPRLLIDCGTEDYLLDGNRQFHADLTRLGIPHEYREFPGAHTWDYWDAHVTEALAFHCAAMEIGGKC